MNDKVLHSRRYYAVLLFLLGALIVMFFSRERKRYFQSSGVVWTTEYHITYEAKRNLDDSIQQIFQRIDRSVSPFNAQSRISAINANKTNVTDSYFSSLYTTARYIYVRSGRLYDPTVMPLVNAWGFGYRSGKMPTQSQIDSILQFVGMNRTQLWNGRVLKGDPRIQFDFSSIAKGFACDEVGRMLRRNGVTNYMVEIGGEIAARGVNDRGSAWHVSVDMPTDNDSTVNHQPVLVLRVDSGGVATSGNYRRFKMVDGKKVTHIINPLTGRGEQSSLLSVTIVAPTCAQADAWATACMVMGAERVQAMLKSDRELGVMTVSVDASGNMVVWSNPRFAQLVQTNK